MHTFKVSHVNLNGTLNTLDNLGESELDTWMFENYGKFATIEIERGDGKKIRYTDNGQEWERI